MQIIRKLSAASVPFLLGLLCLMAVVVAGCARRPPEAWGVHVDLVARQQAAGGIAKVAEIRFGTAEARSHLVDGWMGDEEDSRGPYVRSFGHRSTLSFSVVEPRTMTIRIRLRNSKRFRRVRAMAPELNGAALEAIEIAEGRGVYRTELPRRHLRPGRNLLEFHYESAPSAKRKPSLIWRRLVFEDPTGAGLRPMADAEQRLLFIPYGGRLDYLVTLPPRAELRFDRLDFRGGTSPRLEIRVLTDEDGERTVIGIEPGADEAVPLGDAGAAARLALVAVSTSDGGDAGDASDASDDGDDESGRGNGSQEARPGEGVFLRAPALWAPRADPAATSADGDTGSDDRHRPNIIIYLVDTLRADRLGVYGYDRPVSPRLDSFAANATVFENAVGQCTWTRPSVASIFTGQWPGTHGVVNKRDGLSWEVETLAEGLQAAGYRTIGFVTNPNVAKAFRFHQGFNRFNMLLRNTSSAQVHEEVGRWLTRNAPSAERKPFFLYIHTADPHSPYLPPEAFRDRFAPQARELWEEIRKSPQRETWQPEQVPDLLALYDAEVAANDASFGALLDDLAELQLLEDTLVLFVSDHGEEFFEHGGWSHGKDLHAETLDIPLVIKLPGQRGGRRVTGPAQHIDILPTLFELIGADLPAAVEGRSLLPQLRGESPVVPRVRPAFSHLALHTTRVLGVVWRDWKLMDRRDGPLAHQLLLNRRLDPSENEDFLASHPVTAAVLHSLIEVALATGEGPAAFEATLDAELEASLKALGYL